MKPSHSRRALALDFGRVLTLDPDPAPFDSILFRAGLDRALFHAAYTSLRHDFDRGILDAQGYWSAVWEASRPSEKHRDVRPLLPSLIDADFATWARPRRTMEALVGQALKNGTPTAIVSNMPAGVGDRFVATWPWLGGIGHRFFSADLGLAKPEPEFYRHVLEQTGWDPAQTLFVDDLAANVEGAARAGFQVLLFTGSPSDLETIARW